MDRVLGGCGLAGLSEVMDVALRLHTDRLDELDIEVYHRLLLQATLFQQRVLLFLHEPKCYMVTL